MSQKFSFFKACCGPATLRRGVAVAIIVGTILNLVNHGDEWLSLCEGHSWKVAATYFIPFLVSVHGSAAAKMHLHRQGRPSLRGG